MRAHHVGRIAASAWILGMAALAWALDRLCAREWYLAWRTLRPAGFQVLEAAPAALGVAGLAALVLRQARRATIAFLLAIAGAWTLAAGRVVADPART